jgi:GTPase
MHVVDITHPNAMEQAESFQLTLKEIGAEPIPVITAMNKIDRLQDPEAARLVLEDYPNSFAISAVSGEGIPDLLSALEKELYEKFLPVTVRLPYAEGQLISLFHEQGQVDRIEHEKGGVLIEGVIPSRLFGRFQDYVQP